MNQIELHNVSRFYRIDKNEEKYVLKDISLSFPSCGLVSVLGKSGCGKSTLLNIIGKIDKPSEGKVYFSGEDISKFNEKKTAIFRSRVISYIFQHYHLLENQTAIYNVMIPALIGGDSYKVAYEKATKLLESFSIDKSLYEKRCADLSGGEKERIAILRAFINEPKVILADEPTGALDKENAYLTMQALKKISETSLVIMVTHNESLAKQYSDRIIKMSDGKIVKDERIDNMYNRNDYYLPKRIKSNGNWLNKIVSSNFKKRFKRNLFSITSLVVGLVATMLILGFVNGKDQSITKSMENQFDYGTASISKENRLISSDSPITLIQTMRPNIEERQILSETCSDFHVDTLPCFRLKKKFSYRWIAVQFLFVPFLIENLIRRYRFPALKYVLVWVYSNLLFRLARRRADAFVITNDSDRRHFPKHFQERVFAFYGGVNVEQMPQGDVPKTRDVVFCSRLHPQK